jgi:ribose-phosphate pyrophosphokinase
MARSVLSMPGNEVFGDRLAAALGADTTSIETRRFPDGELYLRLESDVAGRDLLVVCTLAHPDPQFLALVFAARTARELGAVKLTLIAPYLAYMRQDARFHPGEAVTSNHFAALLSVEFDQILTVDPHLHRHRAMSEIYRVPTSALHAAPALSDWIAANVEHPLVIGPDEESQQWVSDVAMRARAPSVVLRKERFGDRDVRVALPDLSDWRDRTPVLVDDIVSSGRTMIVAADGLAAAGLARPVCVAVHALFAEDAYQALSAKAQRVVSTDTVPHASNAISLTSLFVEALRG